MPVMVPETTVMLSDFERGAQVHTAFADYLDSKWRPWADEENSRRKTIRLYAQLFTRSLVIDSKAEGQCPWLSKATVAIEHTGKFGLFKYKVIRSQDQRAKSPWLDGSVLRMPPSPEPQKAIPSRAAAPSRAERFTTG